MITFEQDRWKQLFLTIWAGQAFSLFGSRLVSFSLIWWITTESGSISALAVASLMQTIPQAFLAPFIGALVDRLNRQIIMIISDTLTAFSTIILILLFGMKVVLPWHVYTIIFIRSLGTLFHGTAMMASTSLMVPKDQLTRVSGLNQVLNGTGNIGAPLLGAVLLSILPIRQILIIDLATAFLAIIPILLINIPQLGKKQQSKKETPFLKSLTQGFIHLIGFKGLLLLFIYLSVVWMFAAPAWRFLPLLVSNHLDSDVIHLGLLTSAFGIGTVFGGTFLLIWGEFKNRITTCLAARFISGLCFLMLGLISEQSYLLPIIACVLFGITFSVSLGSQQAILLVSIPKHIQGRIFSIFTWAQSIMQPIGLAIFGLFGDLIGVNRIFIFSGFILVIAALSMSITPSIMKIEKVNI